MQEKRRSPASFVKGINGILLALLLAVLLFLLTRAVLRNTLFALPLLMLTAILLSLSSSRAFWRMLSITSLMVLFFFLEFAVSADQTPFTLPSAIFFSAVSLLTAGVVGRRLSDLRQERDTSLRQLARERSVSALSGQLLTAADPRQLYDLTLRSLYSVTECPAVLFLPDGQGGFPRAGSYPEGLLLYPVEEMIRDCFENARSCGRGTAFHSENVLRCFPVQAEEGHVLAVAGLLTDPERPTGSYPLETVETLLVRCGIALDRLEFMDREHTILMEKELERMRSDFLRPSLTISAPRLPVSSVPAPRWNSLGFRWQKRTAEV